MPPDAEWARDGCWMGYGRTKATMDGVDVDRLVASVRAQMIELQKIVKGVCLSACGQWVHTSLSLSPFSIQVLNLFLARGIHNITSSFFSSPKKAYLHSPVRVVLSHPQVWNGVALSGRFSKIIGAHGYVVVVY